MTCPAHYTECPGYARDSGHPGWCLKPADVPCIYPIFCPHKTRYEMPMQDPEQPMCLPDGEVKVRGIL
ncbi:MAG: hypothetical protein QMD46_12760 [Methanomicrobiales archaeon]|nr:hypothetical protein [Methanomicrobiales archaeon]